MPSVVLVGLIPLVVMAFTPATFPMAPIALWQNHLVAPPTVLPVTARVAVPQTVLPSLEPTSHTITLEKIIRASGSSVWSAWSEGVIARLTRVILFSLDGVQPMPLVVLVIVVAFTPTVRLVAPTPPSPNQAPATQSLTPLFALEESAILTVILLPSLTLSPMSS